MHSLQCKKAKLAECTALEASGARSTSSSGLSSLGSSSHHCNPRPHSAEESASLRGECAGFTHVSLADVRAVRMACECVCVAQDFHQSELRVRNAGE